MAMERTVQLEPDRDNPIAPVAASPADINEGDELSAFIHSIYSYGLGFIAFTVFVWVVVSVVTFDMPKLLPVSPYVLVGIVFLVIVLMNCIPQTAYKSPCKWILTAIVIACTTLAGSCLVCEFSLLTVVLMVLLTTILVLILNFSGAKCPQEALPGGVCSTCMMILLLVLLIVLGIVHLSSASRWALDAFVIILFIMLIVAIPIQAQFNHGRLQVVQVIPRNHLMLSILTLYLHSLIFFCCLVYFTTIGDAREGEVKAVTEEE